MVVTVSVAVLIATDCNNTTTALLAPSEAMLFLHGGRAADVDVRPAELNHKRAVRSVKFSCAEKECLPDD